MPYAINIKLLIDLPGSPTQTVAVGEPFELRVRFDTVAKMGSHQYPNDSDVTVAIPSTERALSTRHKAVLSYAELAPIGIPYSRPHLIRLEKSGLFPKRIQLTPGRVAWRKADIETWIANRDTASK